jgi:glycine oxidase
MAEVVVVGGGVMGLAAARGLRQRGYGVTLLERGQPGRAASWASAGIIGATLRREGDPSTQLRHLSRTLWPEFAASLFAESGLDPEYREMGCIHLAEDDAELRALSRAAGAGEVLDAAQLHTLEPALNPELRGGLLVQGGNVENRRLCKALEIAARRAGVEVRTGVEVHGVATSGGRVGGVDTADGREAADVVVIAAGAWSSTIDGLEPRPWVHPQKGQILALDQASVGIRHVLLTPEDPYFVPRADGRLVIGATREEAGWDASLTAEGVAWLLNRAADLAPKLAKAPIAEMWTGFRPLSDDGVPLIGKGELDGLYFLTAHGPSGIAPLPGSAALLMALMHAEPPPVPAEAFDPLRLR